MSSTIFNRYQLLHAVLLHSPCPLCLLSLAIMPSAYLRTQFLEDAKLVIRYTNNWLLFGLYGFAVFCSIVAAAKGLLIGS